MLWFDLGDTTNEHQRHHKTLFVLAEAGFTRIGRMSLNRRSAGAGHSGLVFAGAVFVLLAV